MQLGATTVNNSFYKNSIKTCCFAHLLFENTINHVMQGKLKGWKVLSELQLAKRPLDKFLQWLS